MAHGDDELLSDAKPAVDEVDLQRTTDAVRQRLFDSPAEPVKLGRFVLIDRLGAGRMGSVYSAYDPKLDRKVAVKLIRRELIAADQVEERQQRLQREAKAMAQINHANVVAVHDVGEHDGQVFIAMELVDGVTLRRWLDGERSAADIIEVFSQMGKGLAAAHDAGVVHRDFKPDNVLIDSTGRARVTDFGLSTGTGTAPPRVANADGVNATRDGSIVGTPSYMALEQLLGQPADQRSDQFSFCVSLYEALYARRPFQGNNVAELAEAMQSASDIDFSGRRLPARLRRAIATGLSATSSARHGSMNDIVAELAPPRTKSGLIGFGLFAVAMVASVLIMLAAGTRSARDRCEAHPEQLAGVWDSPRKQAVRAAILRHGASFAEQTWKQTSATLDGYAAAWSAMRESSCRATHVAGTQSDHLLDLRSQCLERRRQDLNATVSLLASADAKLVRKAADFVSQLTPVTACADTRSLSSPVPMPEDPLTARQVLSIQQRLSTAQARLAAANTKGLLSVTASLVADAATSKHKPTIAETQLIAGRVHLALGKTKAAGAALFDALQSAQASGHTRVVAESATTLLNVATMERHTRSATTWNGLASSAIERLGKPPRLAAARQSTWATSLHHRGKYAAAAGVLNKAIAAMTTAGATGEPWFAKLVHNLANVYHSKGDHASSRRMLDRVLRLRKQLLGPDHPDVAATLNTIAILAEAKGDLELAGRRYREALRITEAALGKDNPAVATFLDNLGGVLAKQGKRKRALTLRMRALGIRERRWGKDSLRVALSLNNLGAMLQTAGDLTRALPLYKRSVLIRQTKLGSGHKDVAASLVNLGDCEVAMGQHSVGLAHLAEAMTIASKTLGKSHPDVAYYFLALGRAQFKHADAKKGLAALERSLEISLIKKAYPGELNDIRFALAQALWTARGDRARARTLADMALAYYEEAGKATKSKQVTAWLAAHKGR